MATIDEFKQIEMKVGTILTAERIEGADKLLKLSVDFGVRTVTEGEEKKEVRDIRQILSGIAEWYNPEDLVGKQCPFVTNLPSRTLRGLESQGMILAVGVGEGAVLLHPDKDIAPGSQLR